MDHHNRQQTSSARQCPARCVSLAFVLCILSGGVYLSFFMNLGSDDDDILRSAIGIDNYAVPAERRSSLAETVIASNVLTTASTRAKMPRDGDLLDSKPSMQRIRTMLLNWMSCIDRSSPPAAITLGWASGNSCNFSSMPGSPLEDKRLVAIMSSWTVEAHGDSTLRELIKLWIGYFALRGSLEKKDANSKLRDAKFFFRTLSETTTSGALSSSGRLKDGLKSEDIAADDPPSTAVMFRMMFRFDFEPSSFFDAFPEDVARSESYRTFFFPKSKLPMAGSKPRGHPNRILLLSTASHIAKQLVMNSSEQHAVRELLRRRGRVSGNGYGETTIEPQTRIALDNLYRSSTAPVEDYLILRLLNHRVQRDPHTNAPIAAVPLQDDSAPPGGQRLPQPRIAVFFLQTMECDSMAEAKLASFREMAAHCSDIVRVIHLQNELILHALSGDENGISSVAGKVHSMSALNVLNRAQRDELMRRTWIIPALECHRGHFRFDGSKRFCTKDGVHLRTKFIRLKLEVMLQSLLQLD